MKKTDTYRIVDRDTGLPIRWHSQWKPLAEWCASMNIGEGRDRYYWESCEHGK